MFLTNKEASEAGLTNVPNGGEFGGNCAVMGALNSNVAIMSLGTQGHIGSGRQCQLPPEEWSSECVLLPKKESNVAVTGYRK